MTNRVVWPAQDFRKMCQQAERDHESKKLIVLLERVKRQIAQRENSTPEVESPKPPVTAMRNDPDVRRLPSRTALFER